MDDDWGVDGHGVAAPARAENAEIAAIDVEGGFESGKVAYTRHHAHADHFHGNDEALRDAVDREIAFDLVGFLSGGFDAGAAKGKRGKRLHVEEIIRAQLSVTNPIAGVEARGLHGHVDPALRWILSAVGQRAAEILEQSFFLEDHPLRVGYGERPLGFGNRLDL